MAFRRFQSRFESGQNRKKNRAKRRLIALRRAEQRKLLYEPLEHRLLLTADSPDLDNVAEGDTTQPAVQASTSFGQNLDGFQFEGIADNLPINPVLEDGEMLFLAAGPHPEELRSPFLDNVNAADTTNTNDIQQPGSLSLDLTGVGITVGVWDGGRIRESHQEFDTRVTTADGSITLSDHATHVAGTIAAAGVDPNAMGMATEVEVRGYDFNNDFVELGIDAGLIDISNHSYGRGFGWEVQLAASFGLTTPTTFVDVWRGDFALNMTEDPSYGKYDADAQDLDQILFDNPHLLSVWSAGNERGEDFTNAAGNNQYATFFSLDPGGIGFMGPGFYLVPNSGVTAAPPPDGNGGTGFDTLSAPTKVAKNNLVVGAVLDVTNDPYASTEILTTSFSSYGPADDGRVKPDVVGNGFQLYSSVSTGDTDYDIYSGTSMAAPNVAGTAALLTQHYLNEFGSKPSAATTKGLLTHTASDAGNPGPDYEYGWGLVNAAEAATFLSDAAAGKPEAQLFEETYVGSTITQTVYSDGTEPLKASIVWTDPAGTAVGGALDNASPVLVNDLDITITDSGGATFFPWTLNRTNPAAPAFRSSANHVDNVEQVLVSFPSAGNYVIEITDSSGVLDQPYSLFVSGTTELTLPPPKPEPTGPDLFGVRPDQQDLLEFENENVLNIAPREMRLLFGAGADIDPATLDAIRVVASGGDGTFGDGNEIIITPGHAEVDSTGNRAILRFASPLVDDHYQIEVFSDNDLGFPVLRDKIGESLVPRIEGTDRDTVEFELDLGAHVISVVPMPVTRDSGGALQQAADTIVVYFNDDDLLETATTDQPSAENASFYRLIDTTATLSEADDIIHLPASVTYDSATDTATLVFDDDGNPNTPFRLPDTTFRLEIGTSDEGNNDLTSATHVGTLFNETDFLYLGYIGDDDETNSSATDDDLYHIEVAAGANLTVTATPGETLNVSIRLLDQNGNAIASDTATSGGTGAAETNTYDNITGGKMYVEVSGAAGTTGSYRLDVGVTANAISGEDDNSSFLTATDLGMMGVAGQSVSARIEPQIRLVIQGTGGQEFKDGDTFTLQGVTFEFDSTDSDALNDADSQRVPFTPGDSAETIADAIKTAIDTAVANNMLAVTTDDNAGDNVVQIARATSLSVSGVAGLSIPTYPQYAGGQDEPGHREIQAESHIGSSGLSSVIPNTIRPFNYNFQPVVNGFINVMTEAQKQTAREILELYSYYLGMETVETDNAGTSIMVGDLKAADPNATSGPGGVAGLGGPGLVVVDSEENYSTFNFGGDFFTVLMHEIGHSIGLGHSYDLATLMGGGVPGAANQRVWPAADDLVHGKRIFRPDANDIDLYEFEITEDGVFTAEIIAERRGITSLLNSVLTLFDVNGEIIARNDDYFSNDSYLELMLNPGTYFVGVTSTGNVHYDPVISDTGFGGTTDGVYDLKLGHSPIPASSLTDADEEDDPNKSGSVFDGDNDGTPGGVFKFWFQAGDTLFVDKANDAIAGLAEGDGTLADPFDNIQSAIDAARTRIVVPDRGGELVNDRETFLINDGLNPPVIFEFDTDNVLNDPLHVAVPFSPSDDPATIASSIAASITSAANSGSLIVTVDQIDNVVQVTGADQFDVVNTPSLLLASNIVRVVANGGVDSDVSTQEDNRPYLIGLDNQNEPLPDGANVLVPQGTTLMIDEAALLKMRVSNLDAGSSTPLIDRSASAIQVLGTPNNSVFIRSIRNDTFGGNSDGNGFVAGKGDYGGIVYRNDSDLEDQGIFLNWVNHADINNGGGEVRVDSVNQVFAPIHMLTARPTVSFNRITSSADAAIAADPNSFDDSLGRIGPEVFGNFVADSSINGLFIRISTDLGNTIDRLTVAARFDDADITHVITENLQINGAAGGPFATTGRTSGRLAIDPGVIVKLTLARIEADRGNSGLIAEGTPDRPIIFTSVNDDRYGGSGTYDTNNDDDKGAVEAVASAGDWGGLAFMQTSYGSLDHTLVTFGGGQTPIEGGFANFNAIEVHQADVRITQSLFEQNANGQDSSSRAGRGRTEEATIYVRGANRSLSTISSKTIWAQPYQSTQMLYSEKHGRTMAAAGVLLMTIQDSITIAAP